MSALLSTDPDVSDIPALDDSINMLSPREFLPRLSQFMIAFSLGIPEDEPWAKVPKDDTSGSFAEFSQQSRPQPRAVAGLADVQTSAIPEGYDQLGWGLSFSDLFEVIVPDPFTPTWPETYNGEWRDVDADESFLRGPQRMSRLSLSQLSDRTVLRPTPRSQPPLSARSGRSDIASEILDTHTAKLELSAHMEVFSSAHLEEDEGGERVVMLCLSEEVVGCDFSPRGAFAEPATRPSTRGSSRRLRPELQDTSPHSWEQHRPDPAHEPLDQRAAAEEDAQASAQRDPARGEGQEKRRGSADREKDTEKDRVQEQEQVVEEGARRVQEQEQVVEEGERVAVEAEEPEEEEVEKTELQQQAREQMAVAAEQVEEAEQAKGQAVVSERLVLTMDEDWDRWTADHLARLRQTVCEVGGLGSAEEVRVVRVAAGSVVAEMELLGAGWEVAVERLLGDLARPGSRLLAQLRAVKLATASGKVVVASPPQTAAYEQAEEARPPASGEGEEVDEERAAQAQEELEEPEEEGVEAVAVEEEGVEAVALQARELPSEAASEGEAQHADAYDAGANSQKVLVEGEGAEAGEQDGQEEEQEEEGVVGEYVGGGVAQGALAAAVVKEARRQSGRGAEGERVLSERGLRKALSGRGDGGEWGEGRQALEEWFKYDGCVCRVRGREREAWGRLVVLRGEQEVRVWPEVEARLEAGEAVRKAHEEAEEGELKEERECMLKSFAGTPPNEHVVTSKGVLLSRGGMLVGVRAGRENVTLREFLRRGLADEVSLLSSGAAAERCPCAAWEGACERCRSGGMQRLAVNHPERLLRGRVVDVGRGIDRWEPLHTLYRGESESLQRFCRRAGVRTEWPRNSIRVCLIGGGGVHDLPAGWTAEARAGGERLVYVNRGEGVEQGEHPFATEKTMAELVGLRRAPPRVPGLEAPGRAEEAWREGVVAEVRAARRAGRPLSAAGRPPSAKKPRPMSAVAERLLALPAPAHPTPSPQKPPRPLRPHSAFASAPHHHSVPSPGPRPQLPELDLAAERAARWAGGRVANRTFSPRRVMPPYSGAAWSASLLLQSCFRGHLHRVFALVHHRLSPSAVLPVRLAALAYQMISLPTTFQMYKRLLVYTRRHGRPMAIPADFTWDGLLNPDVALAKANLIQRACRLRLARQRLRQRRAEKAEAARIPNVIRRAVEDLSDASSVLATKSEAPARSHGAMQLSEALVLTEEEGNALGELLGHTPSLEHLLFLASRDGWSSAALGEACAGRRRLLVLCASSSPEHNAGNAAAATHVFGAFTSIPWARHGGYKKDADACLVSVRSGQPPKGRRQSAGGRPRFECAPFRCEVKAGRGCAVLHYSALHQMDSRFFGGGPLYGRGPDLYLDLDQRANCVCELGSTYGLPADAPPDASPWWLAGSSPFEALEVAVFCFENAEAAAPPADPVVERREATVQRIEAIGEWLEDQEGEGAEAVLAQRNTLPLQVSAALTLSVQHISTLAEWGGFPDVRLSKLLFLASRDGFSNEAFHAKVDGATPATLLLVQTATRFLFGAFCTEPWQSTRSEPNPKTGRPEQVPDLKGTWLADSHAFLFRLEPGPPVLLPQVAYPKSAIRHRHGTGPAFGDRASDLSLDLDQPSRSRSMLGGTFFCPEGANQRTFLAGSFSGWAVLEVAVFKVNPKQRGNDTQASS